MVAIQSALKIFWWRKTFFFCIHATYLLRQPVKMLAGDVTKFCKFCRFWLIYVRGGLPHGRGWSRYEICKLAVRGSSWKGGGGAQTSINRAQNCHQPSRQLSVFSLSIREPFNSEIFREVHWREARESKSPQKYQLVQRERKAEKGSIDFVLNRPPRLPFLTALTLMGWTKGDQEAQNQHDALCSALPPAWAAGSICIMERLGVIQFQGRTRTP